MKRSLVSSDLANDAGKPRQTERAPIDKSSEVGSEYPTMRNWREGPSDSISQDLSGETLA